jgi:hypothetical protein
MPDHSLFAPHEPLPQTVIGRPAMQRPLVQRFVASPAVRSGYTSAVVHVLLLTLLALLWIEPPDRQRPRPLELAFTSPHREAAAAGANATGADEPVSVSTAVIEPPVVESAGAEPPVVESPATAAPAPRSPSIKAVSVATETPTARMPEPRLATVPGPAPPPASPPTGTPSPSAPAAGPSAGYAARHGVDRAAALRAHGGSAASEAAVERGLAWLARHQAADGSWRFDLSQCRCDGSCSQPGTIGSTTASTGIALLPFLGAGNTQAEGPYQETVARGLYYLLGRMRPTARGGDLCEGTMYGQGVATLALAEAYGMTRDDLLARPLVDAVRFIVTAQDTYGGGWRYLPGQSGDTTVTAWQLAALKSAALAGLEVPSPTIDGIRRFLDRVQARGGEAYGYLGSQPQPCTSAIGLFCRLHTAWEERERLDGGLAALARGGPVADAAYLNFYLSQALLQADHAAWPRWNARNRDQLVAQQAALGHEQGSWWFTDRETAPGGRLAHTALALLTLEVYYRVLPLYRPEAVGHEF